MAVLRACDVRVASMMLLLKLLVCVGVVCRAATRRRPRLSRPRGQARRTKAPSGCSRYCSRSSKTRAWRCGAARVTGTHQLKHVVVMLSCGGVQLLAELHVLKQSVTEQEQLWQREIRGEKRVDLRDRVERALAAKRRLSGVASQSTQSSVDSQDVREARGVINMAGTRVAGERQACVTPRSDETCEAG